MAKPCSKPLKQNPFKVRRDPSTGRWLVVELTRGKMVHHPTQYPPQNIGVEVIASTRLL